MAPVVPLVLGPLAPGIESMGVLVVVLEGDELEGDVGPTLGAGATLVDVEVGPVVMGSLPSGSVVEHPSNKRPMSEPYFDVCMMNTQATLAHLG